MLATAAQHPVEPTQAQLSPEERERLVQVARRFKARVEPIPDPIRPGNNLWVGFSNRKANSQTRPMRTEEAAWDALLEKMALTQHGRVVFRSHEFAEEPIGSVPPAARHKYVPMTRSTRVELREMAPNHFEVFEINSIHSMGPAPLDAPDAGLVPRPPIDCHQFRHGTPEGPYVFAAEGPARGFIDAYVEQRELAHRRALQAAERVESSPGAPRAEPGRAR